MMEDKMDELIEEEKKHHKMLEEYYDRINKQNMVKNALLLAILMVMIFHAIFCCPHAPVKGFELDKYVEDQNGNPLANATVIIYNHPNGMVIAQKETDVHGWANFSSIKYGCYYLWVSYGGVTEGEWIWMTEDKQITNTLTLPTEGHGDGGRT